MSIQEEVRIEKFSQQRPEEIEARLAELYAAGWETELTATDPETGEVIYVLHLKLEPLRTPDTEAKINPESIGDN